MNPLSLSIATINRPRHIPFILFIISLFVITIIIFDQQSTQIFLHSPISHSITKENNLQFDKYFPRIHQPLSSSILRGILIYYPIDQEAHFLPELLWLFRSWIEMMKYEPLLWRTDLIIYADKYISNLEELGCIYNQIRINRQQSPQCRVFPYKRIRLRDTHNGNDSGNPSYQHFDIHRSIVLTKHLKKYDFVDSINIIAEYYPSFAMYDYILRTDMDVFLTKNFARFVPYNDIILVGGGAYSTRFNTARLRRIAKDMNWSYGSLTNIGSTWYGKPQTAQLIANYTLRAMIYLTINEFTTPEKEGRLGSLLWPEWHYGVLLLYSGELAFNHLVLNESINLGLAHHFLDQPSTNQDRYDLEKNNRLHIHCWHTFDRFSKFGFKAGQYNNLNPNSFINDTSAAGFCMRMALESRIMSLTGLKEALLQVKNSSKY